MNLQQLLNDMGCVRIGATLYGRCPNCDTDAADPEDYHLLVSPGKSAPVVAFCCKCMLPKPQTEQERQRNRQINRGIWQSYGAVDFVYRTMDSESIRQLWSEVMVGGQPVGGEDELPRADDDTLHRTYSTLLENLTLSDRHRKWLRKVGMEPDRAFEIGYRTAPTWDESATLAKLPYQTVGVPGLTDERWLTRQDSLLIPCRNRLGQIVVLKYRLFDRNKRRMRTLTSKNRGGPSAGAVLHWPVGVWPEPDKPLWIVEGERKADVLAHRMEVNVVGLPGAGRWNLALPVAQEVGWVVLALDQDDTGRRHTQPFGAALTELGVEVLVAKWEGEKGPDDAITKGRKIEVEEWREEGINNCPTPNKKSQSVKKLRDSEVLEWIRRHQPVLRNEVPAYQPFISQLLREGKVRMWKSNAGQVLEAV